jgi:Raf kinase inhibitor-like YbhB/YbcL family protein
MKFALSPMQLRSKSFTAGGAIAKRNTSEGENASPHLAWSNAPAEAKSFAIICHDPDAPVVSPGAYGFVHWALYNLPASTKEVDEGTQIGTAGVNDFGKAGFAGPLPPEGHGDHHYFFILLALDAELNLPQGLTMWQLLQQIEPHVIAVNRLMGTYRR